ncbi:hypothetical protein BGZ76_011848 [Entomortierella beljakovae]|nr:hypothetical protein BGZ76_011848 [Entomortierella beljakovae]
MLASRIVRIATPVSRAIAVRPAAFMAVRSFTAPSAPLMRPDLIKDLYIKGLQGYTPTPDAKGADASSQVKEFKAPSSPSAPSVDAALDLSAWETANTEITNAVSEETFEEADEDEVEEEEEQHH